MRDSREVLEVGQDSLVLLGTRWRTLSRHTQRYDHPHAFAPSQAGLRIADETGSASADGSRETPVLSSRVCIRRPNSAIHVLYASLIDSSAADRFLIQIRLIGQNIFEIRPYTLKRARSLGEFENAVWDLAQACSGKCTVIVLVLAFLKLFLKLTFRILSDLKSRLNIYRCLF